MLIIEFVQKVIINVRTFTGNVTRNVSKPIIKACIVNTSYAIVIVLKREDIKGGSLIYLY